MKNILFAICLLTSTLALAQPQAFNYQGIALDVDGSPITDTNIGVKFSILENTINGTVVYAQNAIKKTSSIGHFSEDIGLTTPGAGDFESIEWGSNKYFLKVEMDVNGGTNYTVGTTVEILSVPLAQYVESSGDTPEGLEGPPGEDGIDGIQGPQGPQGPEGPSAFVMGAQCWDSNGNGIFDANEDTDGNGAANENDCGSKGPQGPQGPQGSQGPQGQQGPQGSDITVIGPQGDPGITGPPGPCGLEGPVGAQGATGEEGDQGELGEKGPTGNKGPISTEVGPQGPKGPRGPAGGPEGPQGPQGPQGITGPPGANGPAGPDGLDFTETLSLSSTVPDPASGITLYADDGSNTTDGKPSLRFFNGTEWIDL